VARERSAEYRLGACSHCTPRKTPGEFSAPQLTRAQAPKNPCAAISPPAHSPNARAAISPPHAPCGAGQGGCARLSRIRDSPRSVRHPSLESEIQSCRHGGLGKCESVAPEPLKNGFRPEKRSKKIRIQILFLSSLRAVPVFRAAVFFNGNPARYFHRIFRALQLPTPTSYVGRSHSVFCRRCRHRCLFPLINPPGFCCLSLSSHRLNTGEGDG